MIHKIDAMMQMLREQADELARLRGIVEKRQVTVDPAKEVLTIEEAAHLAGMSPATLARKARGGELAYYRNGCHIYLRRSEVEAWLTMDRVPPSTEMEAQMARLDREMKERRRKVVERQEKRRLRDAGLT